jgi:hypothetical protein
MRIAILYLLVALLFIGCERNNATLTGPEETDDAVATAFNSMSNPESYSDEYEFEMTIDYDELDFDGNHTEGLAILFNSTSSNVFDLGVSRSVSPIFNEQSTGDLEYDVIAAVSQRIPTNISYNGSSISYTINGQNGSESLSAQERSILDWVQDGLDDAQADLSAFDGCIMFPCQAKTTAKSSKTAEGNTDEIPVQSMSTQEVIDFLEDKGYEVEHLQGKQFQITRHYSEEDGLADGFSATHVFNAATGRIETGGNVQQRGRQIAKTMVQQRANGKAALQALFQRDENSGATRHTRISAQRKDQNQ